tara:strand:- start:5013 stop:7748 length:2736 start_codon:yes stop_codon:yes gene_type:complete
MALKKLVADLTQGLEAYPNHNTSADTGGFNYGRSTSVFDTKTFNQRSYGYTNPLSRQDNPSPLIPQILPGVNQEPNNSILYLDDAPDGFLRGGILNAQKKAAYDNIRINRFFKTGEGISFIINQQSLQKSNPIIQEGGGNLDNIFEDILQMGTGITSTSANTNRTFNYQNLIKQITEGGYTGNYYNRAGKNPTIQSEEQNKYNQIHRVGRKFDANTIGSFSKHAGLESGNRLISLGKKLQVGVGGMFNINHQTSLMEQNTNIGFDIGSLLDTFNTVKDGITNLFNNPLEALSQPGEFSENQNIGFNPGENVIYQYSGGPGSTYGIGDTILYRYERTSGNYDHQGHPLSINQYFLDKGHSLYTLNSNEIVSFYNEDGTFNVNNGLNFLANTANDNLFGGNNILGAGGLLFDDNFNFNPLGNIVEGLGNQLFGQETTNFIIDLFDGGGVTMPGQPQLPKPILSYRVGQYQNRSGKLFNPSLFTQTGGGIGSAPKPGFIKHEYTKHSSSSVMEGSNKPDDIAVKLDSDNRKSIGLAANKILSFAPDSSYYTRGATNLYKVTTTNISEEGRRRFDDGVINGLPNEETTTNHYYSNILKKQVNPSTLDGTNKRGYIQEERIGKGNPGMFFTGKNQNNYTTKAGLSYRIDKINALDIHTVTDGFDSVLYRDLVPFRFEAMNTEDPNTVDVMAFRAFLDDYGDSYNAAWNSFKYNGRGEDFYTYGGFKRNVTFSFKMAAQSRAEMMPLYRKLNYLCTTLAPDYSNVGRMRGNFIKMSIGSLLDKVPGFLTSISLKWQKDYPWEIALGNAENNESKMHVLPHVLDVQCNFTPIHNFVPRKSITDSPFFGTTGGDARGWDGGSAKSTRNALNNTLTGESPGVPVAVNPSGLIDLEDLSFLNPNPNPGLDLNSPDNPFKLY